MVLALGGIAIFSHTKPYINDRDDVLSMVAQWQVFFICFFALLVKLKFQEKDGYSEEVRNVALCVVIFTTPASCVAMVCEYFRYAVSSAVRLRRKKADAVTRPPHAYVRVSRR